MATATQRVPKTIPPHFLQWFDRYMQKKSDAECIANYPMLKTYTTPFYEYELCHFHNGTTYFYVRDIEDNSPHIMFPMPATAPQFLTIMQILDHK